MEVKNRELELQTIEGNVEQKLIKGVDSKIPRPVVGMLFNNEKVLRDYNKNHATEEGFGVTRRFFGVRWAGKVLDFIVFSFRKVPVKQKIPYVLINHRK